MLRAKLSVGLVALTLVTACGTSKSSSGSKPGPQTPPAASDDPSGQDQGQDTKAPAGPDAQKPEPKQDEPKKPEPKKPVDNRTACEKSWDDYVSYNSADEYLLYRTKTTGANFETVVESRQTVKESSNEKVVWIYATTINGNTTESESAIEKKQFLDNCKNNDVQKPVEEGDEKVEVPAGSYDAHWEMRKYENTGSTSIAKSFITTLESGDKIMVKSVTDVESQFPTKTVMELMETNKK